MNNPKSIQAFPKNGLNFISPFFFAALFFLGSADQFFTTHLAGFNFRWGQLLLLVLALIASTRLLREAKDRSASWELQWRAGLFWAFFFLSYAIAALCSSSPHSTLLKWAWGVFNIGGALLVGLSPQWEDWSKGAFTKGFQWAMGAIAGFIWIQALAIYWLGFYGDHAVDRASILLHSNFTSLPFSLGYVQESWPYDGITIFRPNAFYYEPSFAGCALAFSLPLLLVLDRRQQGARSGWLPAVVLGAILLTTSRSGMLSAALCMTIILFFSLIRKQGSLVKLVLKTLAFFTLLILLFCLSPSSRKYIDYIFFPMGTQSLKQFDNPNKSEGGRIANAKNCLILWSHHPFLGDGVQPLDNEKNRGLSQVSKDTWLELGVESGLLGFLSFAAALLASARLALKKNHEFQDKLLVMATWCCHGIIHLNLTQTYPRLDYWLFFFLSLRLLTQKPNPVQSLKK